ncbi:conserved hypothetical protein [Ricinus communis]|uniref:Uncharacterized protein n=1 Tax=Ricinus communis TaxID=3988 RepID=B9SU33_RICCO|nr:conserved hypothetical protein [Ricinus communis]
MALILTVDFFQENKVFAMESKGSFIRYKMAILCSDYKGGHLYDFEEVLEIFCGKARAYSRTRSDWDLSYGSWAKRAAALVLGKNFHIILDWLRWWYNKQIENLCHGAFPKRKRYQVSDNGNIHFDYSIPEIVKVATV